MGQLIKQQREDIRGALLNSSPDRLIEKYFHLQLTKQQRFANSAAQRKTHERKLDQTFCVEDEQTKVTNLFLYPYH